MSKLSPHWSESHSVVVQLFVTPWAIQSMGFSRPEAFPFSRGSSQPRDWTQVSLIAGGFFTSWATREAQEDWSGEPIPSPADLPNPGIELGCPALQADSLPAELSGKPQCHYLSPKSNHAWNRSVHFFAKPHWVWLLADTTEINESK